MDKMKTPATQRHLAWHETLELHELVVFQSVGLMKLKQTHPKIKDPTLKVIYQQAITALSKNIEELLRFYSIAAHPDRDIEDRQDNLPFYAGDLLSLTKTSIRNYAIAITETATPQLRDVLKKQLMAAIDLHATVYNYMYQNSLYPSYDLNRLLKNDMNLAAKALSAPY
ncbi:spore coat protein F [Gracilibacillus halotolerans]|uniref:Spore coat protein F n=1 Tax=Gracilibacillus halotolerans TaxID=74386 RepID=A0A841RH61_9BACI|nr:spore coat protein [Gracilibacillus halotolerans]MBB6513500.1 spore coat protein F [Gracilibacillus halotolerans]